MASGIDEILETARNGTETIFDGIKGFRDAFNTGESRVTEKKPDYARVALYVGGALVAAVLVFFVVKKL
jgi:hypothetical protein